MEHLTDHCYPEFTDHQRSVFCVFSGQGVVNLRKHFNRMIAAEESRRSMRAAAPVDVPIFPATTPLPQLLPQLQTIDTGFDEGDPDALDDEDVLDGGTEMVIDTAPLLNNHNMGLGVNSTAAGAIPVPPPIPTLAQGYVGGPPPYIHQTIPFHGTPVTLNTPTPPHHSVQVGHGNDVDIVQGVPNTAGLDSVAASATANEDDDSALVHANIDISSQPGQLQQPGPAHDHETHPMGGS